MKTKVFLRQKHILGNKVSLYLDYWPPIANRKTGKLTRREFLKEHLISDEEYEKQKYFDERGKEQVRIVPVMTKSGKIKKRKLTAIETYHNKEIQDRAEILRNNKENELSKPSLYSSIEQEKLKLAQVSEGSFIEFFKKVADEKTGSDKENWNRVYKSLKEFSKTDIAFKDLTEELCMEYRSFLLNIKAYKGDKKICQNTAVTYFVKFKAGVKEAYWRKKIPINIGLNLKPIKMVETIRSYLTLAELNKLAKTDCANPMMKNAALFSGLTGLRKGDILNLCWKNIETIDGRKVIRVLQQKTKGVVTIWLSEQAFGLLGTPGKPQEKVFPGLKLDGYHTKHLYRWLGEAGVTKQISFHNFRHTFATLQLSSGTDIYTVSKLLGHKNVKTTQIYTKVVDKLKKDAADRIILDM